jgi:hypothetical protein
MDKMTKDMKGKPQDAENAANAAAEMEDLTPEGDIPVPTGDEAHPTAAPDPKEARKQLYEKARKRRQDTVSREAEEHIDVERLQAMQEEASGGEKPDTQIDTNRHDYEEKRGLKEPEPELEATPEEEIVNEEDDSADASLQNYDPDAKIAVKILGKEYLVPQQDIDDAGGLETYQKSRAATMRLQRVATLDRALQQAGQEQGDAHGEQQETDPSTDGLGEADIASLREEVIDAMVGDDDPTEAVDKVLEKALRRKPRPVSSESPSEQPNEVSAAERQIIEDAKRELAAEMEADRVSANDMMRREYSDIMGDQELLGLAQQRFSVLMADSNNEGRSQKELARESAEYVRSLGKRLLVQPSGGNSIENERQERIKRKKKLPRTSRADAPSAPKPQERKTMSNREYLARLRRMQGHDLAE